MFYIVNKENVLKTEYFKYFQSISQLFVHFTYIYVDRNEAMSYLQYSVSRILAAKLYERSKYWLRGLMNDQRLNHSPNSVFHK